MKAASQDLTRPAGKRYTARHTQHRNPEIPKAHIPNSQTQDPPRRNPEAESLNPETRNRLLSPRRAEQWSLRPRSWKGNVKGLCGPETAPTSRHLTTNVYTPKGYQNVFYLAPKYSQDALSGQTHWAPERRQNLQGGSVPSGPHERSEPASCCSHHLLASFLTQDGRDGTTIQVQFTEKPDEVSRFACATETSQGT